MSNTRLLYDSDTWDAATITSSSEEGDLIDDNAVNDYVGRAWRTTGDSAEWIKFDLGAAATITEVSLAGLNLTSAATVTVEGHTSDSWASPDVQEVIAIATNADSVVFQRLTIFLTAGTSKRWWRITLVDAANTDGYIEVGRIKGGAYYELNRNMDDNFKVSKADPSEGEPQPGTLSAFRSRTSFRRAALNFTLIDVTQRRKMEAVFDKVGNNTPLVVSLDPDDYPSEQSMFCRMLTPLEVAYYVVGYHNQGTIVYEEITE